MSWFSEGRRMSREYMEAKIALEVSTEKIQLLEQQIILLDELDSRIDRLREIHEGLGELIDSVITILKTIKND